MKERVYVAGPMSGYPEFNYPAFNKKTQELREKGYEVVNPVEIGDKFGTAEEINKDKNLLRDILVEERREVAKCDIIYLLKGWEKSIGAKRELEVALALDLKIVVE